MWSLPLDYLTQHFKDVRVSVADYMSLVEDGWRRAWYAQEGGYRGFSTDVARVLQELREPEIGSEKKRNGRILFLPHVGEQIRCVLCLVSIGTLVANILSGLLVQALQLKLLRDNRL